MVAFDERLALAARNLTHVHLGALPGEQFAAEVLGKAHLGGLVPNAKSALALLSTRDLSSEKGVGGGAKGVGELLRRHG